MGRGGGHPSSILVRGKPRLIRQVAIQDEMPSGSSIKSVSFQVEFGNNVEFVNFFTVLIKKGTNSKKKFGRNIPNYVISE